MPSDRDLLFGVLALQAGLINKDQFVQGCTEWSSDKDKALAVVLVEHGWLTPDDKDHVDYLVKRKLAKHGGDVQASLAAVGQNDLQGAVADVQNDEVRKSLSPTGRVLLSTVATEPRSRERYTLTRLHATGGIGRVWLARDNDLCREVALKELQPERLGSPVASSRFLEEARITGQLEHPGIVPVYELSKQTEGRPFYTMRFIRGRTFHDAIVAYHKKRAAGETGPLDLRELLGAFVGVCNAVAYAHSRGVLHRDLKPQNVVLGDFGEVMVLDWGLAKLKGAAEDTEILPVSLEQDESRQETRQGQVLGTPSYMAPEQAQGRVDLFDERTDVYGLGAVLYELLTGKPPFAGPDTQEVLKQVVHESPPAPRRVVPSAPAPLEAICVKALAKPRGDRYASAQDVASEVQRWLGDEPVSAYREPLRLRARRWARRHRSLVDAAAAAAAVTLVLGGVAAWWFDRQRVIESRQEAALEQVLSAALWEVAQLQEWDQFSAAGSVLSLAETRLGEKGSEGYRRWVSQAFQDLELLENLDAIRISKVSGVERNLDVAGADQRYEAEFSRAGLGKVGDAPAQVAERVRASSAFGRLLVALYDWAACATGPARRNWVLDVARRVDNPTSIGQDPNFDPVTWADPAALSQLAQDKSLHELRPRLVAAMAVQLLRAGRDVGFLRTVQVRLPDDFWLNFLLGFALRESEPSAAVGYYRAALALRPDAVAVREQLGRALYLHGRLADAAEEFREVTMPPRPNPRSRRVGRLIRWHEKSEEEERLRRVISRGGEGALPHLQLGDILLRRDEPSDAVAEYCKAMNVEPASAQPHIAVGWALHSLKRPREAEEEFRKALAQEPKAAIPRYQFGEFLYRLGRKSAASDEYRRAIALDPNCLDDVKEKYRYHAACAAAAAADGSGVDSNKLDDQEKARLRAQALIWLKADLAVWSKQPDRAKVQQTLRHWQQDPDLARVRDALDKLPPKEQGDWRKLWSEVDEVLKKAGG